MSKIDTPIRIAHIVGIMAAGGVESVVMNYYRHINRARVQFDFIIDEDSAIVPIEEIESLGGRIFKIPSYKKPIAYHKALKQLLTRENYRIVHSHINTLSVFPLFAAKRANVPVRISHSHSTAGKGELARNVFKYTLRPFSKIFPTHYCACSEYAGRWLFGDKLHGQGLVNIVKNAIDLSKFKFDPLVRAAVRQELGVENSFVIGHVGRFMKQKNHSFLIDIFKQVHLHNPGSALLLIGEGELEQEIQAKVEHLGIADCVQFLGVRDDVHRLLMGMDLFLLPSLYEGLPVVGVEAQACGLPIIASGTVTSETKILDNFEFMPLDRPAVEWADKVLGAFPDNEDREFAMGMVAEHGYRIEIDSEILGQWYLAL